MGRSLVPLVLYALHRLAPRLEERGYLYYWHTKPEPGGWSAAWVLQEIYQPRITHVIEVETLAADEANSDRFAPTPDGNQPDATP